MGKQKLIIRAVIKVSILVLAVIALLIIIRFGIPKNITLNSFDNNSSISFGTHLIKQKSTSFGKLNFKVADVDEFIDNVLLKQDSFLYTAEDQHYTYYVFNNDGYYYIAYAGLTTVTIENLSSEHNAFLFPFFCASTVISPSLEEESETIYTWAEINKIRYGSLTEQKFASYEDVKAFYEQVNNVYWQADDINKTIQLKVYQKLGDSLFGETRISDDYYITLVCDEAGITILYDGHY